MCTVHVSIRCSGPLSEELNGNVVRTELLIESIIGTALMEVLDTVFVDGVRVQIFSESDEKDEERHENSIECEM